jgi:hypothetical protein
MNELKDYFKGFWRIFHISESQIIDYGIIEV